MKFRCTKCESLGLVFDRDYKPIEHFHGKKDSKIYFQQFYGKGVKSLFLTFP
jgi:hypothetical protein